MILNYSKFCLSRILLYFQFAKISLQKICNNYLEKKKLTGMTVCKFFNMWPTATILQNLKKKDPQGHFPKKDWSLNLFCIFKCTCRWIVFLWYLTHYYDLGTGPLGLHNRRLWWLWQILGVPRGSPLKLTYLIVSSWYRNGSQLHLTNFEWYCLSGSTDKKCSIGCCSKLCRSQGCEFIPPSSLSAALEVR